MIKDAILSSDRKYRYVLKRQWGNSNKFVNFILLNPSTADETNNDPTIKRCIGFAKKWGYDGILVTNLFAFRTSNPRILKQEKDPIGKENNNYLIKISRESELVIVAWGNHGDFLGRNKEVLEILPEVFCLATTKSGNPKHPLYINQDTKPKLYQNPAKFLS